MESTMLIPFAHPPGVLIFFSKDAILRLLFTCCPATICRLIVAVYVFSLKGMFWGGTRTHVRKEILKRIKPTVTDGYTSTTIAFIVGRMGIKASLFHAHPRLIFFCTCRPMLAAMVVAASVFSALKIKPYGKGHSSAIAPTLPKSSPFSIRGTSNDFKFRKFLTSQISEVPCNLRHVFVLTSAADGVNQGVSSVR